MSFTCPDCKQVIPGTNCAFSLSRIFNVKAKKKQDAYCKCMYLIRAKKIRKDCFKQYIDDDKYNEKNAFIYCQTINNQPHVYYGTYEKCQKGNGLPASKMSSVGVFQRYTRFESG